MFSWCFWQILWSSIFCIFGNHFQLIIRRKTRMPKKNNVTFCVSFVMFWEQFAMFCEDPNLLSEKNTRFPKIRRLLIILSHAARQIQFYVPHATWNGDIYGTGWFLAKKKPWLRRNSEKQISLKQKVTFFSGGVFKNVFTMIYTWFQAANYISWNFRPS